jgi:hypothetical protein
MYWPSTHSPWQFPSLSWRVDEPQEQLKMELAPVDAVDNTTAVRW